MENQVRVNVKDAEILISEVFQKKDCIKQEANLISKRLCLSNLKGHDSHGIVRVLVIVIGLMKAKFFQIKNIH